MIARLRGSIIEIQTPSLIIDVQSVGYAVHVADDRHYQINQVVDLHVYYNWNQEQGPQLYGFEHQLSKTLFMHIISCSGVGPKLAMTILAHMQPQDFMQAILAGNVQLLSSTPGIGTKKAELMITQLKDKVPKIIPAALTLYPETHNMVKIKQLQAALAALNYKQTEISNAVEFVNKELNFNETSFEDILRKSLSYLAKRL